MKKKNLTLALILPLFFGPIGLLYSSVTAGITMFVVNIVLGIVLGIANQFQGDSLSLMIFFSLIVKPTTIFWSIIAAKRKNEAIDENKIVSSNEEFNIGSDALLNAFILIFVALSVTFIISQFNETNILATNKYVFLLLELVLIIISSVTPNKFRYKTN